MIATIQQLIAGVVTADEIPFDDKGYTTIDPIFPPLKELVPGTLASLIVFGLLWKYAWPTMKKSFNDRTARIQDELDSSAQAKVDADAEAAQIRQAKGDIESERARLRAEAEAQAAALLADGRVRLQAEIAELEARADAEIASAASRSSDELRAEISRHAGVAVDTVVAESLDAATHEQLIEHFISRVGASA
jgi:F-type H+-transporting ATPase subunit b